MGKKSKYKNKDNTYGECKLFVNGMHCASCEVLIERKLLKEKGVKFVDASLKDSSVVVKYEGRKPELRDLNKLFIENGYTFSQMAVGDKKDEPLFSFKNNLLHINNEKFEKYFLIGLILIIVLILFRYLHSSGVLANISLNSTSSYVSFFLFGLIAGLSSCAALVGGLLLSLSKQWSEMYIDSDSKSKRLIPFTMFNIGRLVSFTILGGILGSLGGVLGLSLNGTPLGTAILIIVVSIVMLILGLQMLGVQWAQRFRIALPKSVSRMVVGSEKTKGVFTPLIIGAGTFFLPCGFTLIAQGFALTSGSFLTGALMMLAFSLGTLPVLAGIGFMSSSLSTKPKLNYIFTMVAGVLVVFFSLYNINSQLNVLGFKSVSDIKIGVDRKDEGSDIEYVDIDESGTQVMNITATGFIYQPEGSTNLKAGVPAKLVVNNVDMIGCGNYMAARGLFPSFVELKPGENTIYIPNPVKGTYKLTCSMGMVAPVTIRVI